MVRLAIGLEGSPRETFQQAYSLGIAAHRNTSAERLDTVVGLGHPALQFGNRRTGEAGRGIRGLWKPTPDPSEEGKAGRLQDQRTAVAPAGRRGKATAGKGRQRRRSGWIPASDLASSPTIGKERRQPGRLTYKFRDSTYRKAIFVLDAELRRWYKGDGSLKMADGVQKPGE